MRRAKFEDKNVVVDILTKSVKNDPHINFLLEKSKSKNKLRIIMEYVFEESFNKGEIYLNDENTAAALWNTTKKGKFTWKSICRYVSLLFKIGLESTIRVFKADNLIEKYHSGASKFAHLCTIGVLPESRGKGYVKKLIDGMIDKMRMANGVLYLETADTKDIGTYNKVGFHVFKTINMEGHTLFCMKRQ